MLYPLDADRCVVNEAAKEKIDPEYMDLIEEVIRSARSEFSEKLRSFFVRGSVPVGRARHGISDLDCVVFLYEPMSRNEQAWRNELALQLETKYPFVTMVDLTCLTLGELLEASEYRRLQIYLATQSVCLYGEDVLNFLGKVCPSKELALDMYQGLDEELNALTEYFSDFSKKRVYLSRERSTEFWCVWTMRTLLRSGLGLVMCRRPVYSQDLQTCYTSFVEIFPEYKKEMGQALAWAREPIGNKGKIVSYLKSFVPRYLALWRNVGLDVNI